MSIVLMGSTSGSVTLQEPAVAGSTVLNLPATTGTVGLTTSQIGMKNRIINGAMVIDQRNAGASVTPTGTFTYTVDRWQAVIAQASKFSVQQNAGSVTPPTGYKNYLGVTSLSAYSVGANDYFNIAQYIEGFNIADLNWGTANAQTVTLSFWVRSSLTGTFGGSIRNAIATRSYPFSYSISSANTWEQKSITIAGDTTGTWATDNTSGIQLFFGLGAGSAISGTAGSWSGSNFLSATGATSVVGTNGATFYITGVQLELGSVATTFDFRSITTELALCQRYYWKTYNLTVAPGTTSAAGPLGTIINGVGYAQMPVIFPVAMRGTPTITFYNDVTGATGTWRDGGASDRTMSYSAGQNSGYVYNYTAATNSTINGHLVAAIEL